MSETLQSAVRGPPILPVGELIHFADVDSWHETDQPGRLDDVR